MRIYWTRTVLPSNRAPATPVPGAGWPEKQPSGSLLLHSCISPRACCSSLWPCCHELSQPSHWESWVPSLPSDLAIFLALCGLQSPYPPWEVVTFLSKDRAGPTQSPLPFGIMNSVEANGVQVPSLSESLQLLLLQASVSQFPSSSNPLRYQGLGPQGARQHMPWQEKAVGTEQGVGQLPGQVPGRSQEELGFSTEG